VRIKIAERLHPFTHLPGMCCLLPGSSLCLQLFPARIRLYDLSKRHREDLGELILGLTGPVRDFTAIQDLERGEVRLSGHALEGYFRLVCRPLAAEKKMAFAIMKGNIPVELNTEAVVLTKEAMAPAVIERLSLGSHKAQDWTLMQRRKSLQEILPIWFSLGQLMPQPPQAPCGGLLQECRDLIDKCDREKLSPAFLKVFLAAFSDMLVPHLKDENFGGFSFPEAPESLSPLVLLTEGAAQIRRLFLQQEGSRLAILPVLPPELPCGRGLGWHCPPYGRLDLEWTKKAVRRLIFHAECDGSITFLFPPDLKEFRFQKKERLSCGSTISIEKGQDYLLDNFRR
jgi:hypothetical protein